MLRCRLTNEMLGQMRYIPLWFHYFGGLADKLEESTTPIDKPGIPDPFNMR